MAGWPRGTPAAIQATCWTRNPSAWDFDRAMIETEQTVTIREGIENVWDFARDLRGWAELMPGMQECEVIDDDNSRWTLKVGVGGLVRTVRVQVRVDQWDG